MSETLTIAESAVRPLAEDGTMPVRVKDACEACFAAHKGDCSGVARAVSRQLGVNLQGSADQIVDAFARWTSGGGPGQGRKSSIGWPKGLRANAPGPARSRRRGRRRFAEQGEISFGVLGQNFAWIAEDRDRDSYSMHPLPSAAEPCGPHGRLALARR
jgi:hypothetical protein